MYRFTGIVGLVTLVAPFLFRYSDSTGALWTSLIIGALLIVSSVFEALAEDRERWEYVAETVLGAMAIIAPFALGFRTVTSALLTSIIVGVVAIGAAGSRLVSGELK